MVGNTYYLPCLQTIVQFIQLEGNSRGIPWQQMQALRQVHEDTVARLTRRRVMPDRPLTRGRDLPRVILFSRNADTLCNFGKG